MTYDEVVDDTYIRQLRRARRYESFVLYQDTPENDAILLDFMSLMRGGFGERFDRSKAFDRFLEIERKAFEDAHKGDGHVAFNGMCVDFYVNGENY